MYPLSRMEDMLGTFSKAKIFSILDATSGYCQIPLQEEDRQKTRFIIRKGLFQFKVMPFGLKNAPTYFQRTMNTIFSVENESAIHG